MRTRSLISVAGVSVGVGLSVAAYAQEETTPPPAAEPDSAQESAASVPLPDGWAKTELAFELPTDLLAAEHGDVSATRLIERTATVDLPAEAAWRLWATSEGIASWLTGYDDETGSPNARVEAHIGGHFEWYFATELPEGYRGSEGCRVLAYLPGRMLAFTWNSPPYFSDIRDTYTQVVVLFDEEESEDGSLETRVTLTHLGWPESVFVSDEEIDPRGHAALFGYFSQAWGSVLAAFSEKGREAAETLGLE